MSFYGKLILGLACIGVPGCNQVVDDANAKTTEEIAKVITVEHPDVLRANDIFATATLGAPNYNDYTNVPLDSLKWAGSIIAKVIDEGGIEYFASIVNESLKQVDKTYVFISDKRLENACEEAIPELSDIECEILENCRCKGGKFGELYGEYYVKPTGDTIHRAQMRGTQVHYMVGDKKVTGEFANKGFIEERF